MTVENEPKCCVSGSFKFKPEIDLAIRELKDLRVTVLSPEEGWICIPFANPSFRPLPTEVGKSIKQIEDNFLSSVRKSDFLYVVNPNGYLGMSACLEIGFAVANDIPVFMQNEPAQTLDIEPVWSEIKPNVTISSIKNAVEKIKLDNTGFITKEKK
jgi:hypothetical protein